MQLGAFWLIGYLGPRHVRLDVLGELLLGAKEDRTVRDGFELLRQQLGLVLTYYLGLLAMGALAGWGTRAFVRWRKFDRRYTWLRYDNQWHYLLTGEILETPDLQPAVGLADASLIDFVFVDVLVKLEKGNMLYSGILVDYELGADGGLRTLYLRQTRRKQLAGTASETLDTTAADAEPAEGRYYDVLGDLMIIPYAQTLNLNLTYYVDENDLSAPDQAADNGGSQPTYQVSAPTTDN